MEEENMKNTMDSIADVEQHGIKLSRAASKVTFKLKLILVYHKNVTIKQRRTSSYFSVHQYRVKLR